MRLFGNLVVRKNAACMGVVLVALGCASCNHSGDPSPQSLGGFDAAQCARAAFNEWQRESKGASTATLAVEWHRENIISFHDANGVEMKFVVFPLINHQATVSAMLFENRGSWHVATVGFDGGWKLQATDLMTRKDKPLFDFGNGEGIYRPIHSCRWIN